MVTAEGRVKVLDFGLAKAIYGEEERAPALSGTATAIDTAAGNLIGTPAYMSPEQARGDSVDQRTDIWSFGCLLYELLTGERVFRAGTTQETIAAVLEREPDWQRLPANIPVSIRQLLRRCFQKDVNQRLGSIADARKIIEQAEQGRNRWRIAGVCAVVLVLAAVIAILLQRSVRPTDSSQWVQLTKFPDAVSQPALSPDGRMVAFVRGESTFYGAGQIYVKILPDGSPMRLTGRQLRQDESGLFSGWDAHRLHHCRSGFSMGHVDDPRAWWQAATDAQERIGSGLDRPSADHVLRDTHGCPHGRCYLRREPCGPT
jgi:hypothetical protein